MVYYIILFTIISIYDIVIIFKGNEYKDIMIRDKFKNIY